jgi:hypothetical protein
MAKYAINKGFGKNLTIRFLFYENETLTGKISILNIDQFIKSIAPNLSCSPGFQQAGGFFI